MSQKFSNKDRYSATPDQMIAMMSDPEYIKAKYEALGDLSFDVLEQSAEGDSLKIKVDRTMKANLPNVAKKVLGETSQMIQTENWSTGGATKTATMEMEAPGKPIKIHSTLEIAPVGDSECDYTANFEIKASIPLVGGKIEKIIVGETKDSLVKEEAFNSKWLADH